MNQAMISFFSNILSFFPFRYGIGVSSGGILVQSLFFATQKAMPFLKKLLKDTSKGRGHFM